MSAGGRRGKRGGKVGGDDRRYGGDEGDRKVDIHERRLRRRLGRRCTTSMMKLPGTATTTATVRGAKAKGMGDGGVVRKRREGGGWRSRKGEESWEEGGWGGDGSRGEGVG